MENGAIDHHSGQRTETKLSCNLQNGIKAVPQNRNTLKQKKMLLRSYLDDALIIVLFLLFKFIIFIIIIIILLLSLIHI